jgi:hypothetical protein
MRRRVLRCVPRQANLLLFLANAVFAFEGLQIRTGQRLSWAEKG